MHILRTVLEWLYQHGSAIWAAVGPLIGVFVGAFIANRNQRKQWLNDRKREEYQEVPATITKSAMIHAQVIEGSLPPGGDTIQGDVMRSAQSETIQIIQNRLFIAPEMDELKVRKRLNEAIGEFHASREAGQFHSRVDELLRDIRAAAREDIGLKP